MEKPEIRADILFRNNLALAIQTAHLGNSDDPVHHEHIGHGELRITRAEHFAART